MRARAFIAAQYPARLAEFDATFEILRTPTDFRIKHIHQLFEPAVLAELQQMVNSLKLDETEQHELLTFGRLVVHDQPLLAALQQQLIPSVCQWVGEAVEPSYNFLSLYNNLGTCEPHMDAPSAKWTVDLCISQSAPWPIHFSRILPWPQDWHQQSHDWSSQIRLDPDNRFSTYVLEEGAALVFAGSSQWHYRERIARTHRHNFCNLAFFHFIPKGQRPLTNPANWADIFGIKELSGLVVALP